MLLFPGLFYFMNLWSLEFIVLFLCRCQCIITHLVSTLPQQLSSTDPLPQFSTTHSGVNRSPRLPSKQVCTSGTHFFSCSTAFAGETWWLCSNWTAEEKAGCCSPWKYSENYKLRNLLLGHPEQWKSRGCILHPCCPACSAAVSSVSVLQVAGHRESWEGGGVSSHTARSSQPLRLPFVMGSPRVFVPPCVVAWSAVMQKGADVLHHLVLCLGPRSGEAVRGCGRRDPVRLEGGPLHCKRVSSRSHSEPVSFPAVSCHSGWLQSERDRGGAGLVCVRRGQELCLSRSHRISR